jgi:hypothetical protein
VSGTVLIHHESADVPRGDPPPPGDFPQIVAPSRTDVSLILSADRTFSRERYRARAFAVYSPSEGSSFLRAIGTSKLHDDVALEGSVGWFAGDGRDTIGRFADSDFLYLRLKYYF